MKFLSILILLVSFSSFSQEIEETDTTKLKELEEVIVTSYRAESLSETSLNITSLKIDSLTRYGNFNLTDLMAKTPGVSMLTTGVAIAKPVIRGLYGNRVLMLISGLKFDNQQWQEEHGLGLSDVGLSKVELIKGPMSVLYGTEAMGGIINLIEEDKAKTGTKESDYSLKLNSNTAGGQVQYGYKVNYGKKWFRLRVGFENNSDYSDGNNTRVLNSRFDGTQVKMTYGFTKKRWTSTNNYMGTFNRYGFIFNDVYESIDVDKRYSRKLNVNPCHLVLLNILSSENKFQMKDSSKIYLNFGVQSNERMENEGGGAISLNMHLLTIQYLLKWEKKINKNNNFILSNLGSFENNTNFGSRKIVPDANMQEANISAYLETSIKQKIIFENGIGIGEKIIQTLLTPTVNTPLKDIHPFTKFSVYYNAYTGVTFFPSNKFNIKANLATGVRVPNLAELSSNGLHEGVFTYEVGDPTMKNEQNFSFNIFTNFKKNKIDLSISPFYNYFLNYVYLAPTAESWFGFPLYRYKQQNATQYGTEAIVTYKPNDKISTSISYSGMISKTQDGNFTPYIPAQKINTSVNYTLKTKRSPIQFYSNADFYFDQNNTAPNEIKTHQYWLLNAGASSTITGSKHTFIFTLAGNNLLNVAYYDHLSRFKYFGLLNIGRNIAVNVKIKFNSKPVNSK